MPCRIFVVEDHQILREGLRLLAQRDPDLVIVGEAGSAQEALAGLDSVGAVDLLLTDYRLPDGDGLGLLPKLRKKNPKGLLIVLSGNTTRALVRSCLIAGANGFVTKEEGGAEILRAIRVVRSGETFLSTRAASVVAESLRMGDPSPAADLSKQELAVLRGIATGQTYKEIAQHLGISEKSVETYRSRLAKKTGHRSKVALARFAVEQGFVAS